MPIEETLKSYNRFARTETIDKDAAWAEVLLVEFKVQWNHFFSTHYDKAQLGKCERFRQHIGEVSVEGRGRVINCNFLLVDPFGQGV